MDLSVVIVNWKVKDLLRKCLASIYQGTAGLEFEVIVADNDSRDGSVEMVAKEFPKAEIIASNRNLGFAKANNEAIARSRGEFVLLLNPDTEAPPGALDKIVGFMRRNPHVAIFGPKILNPDGSLQPSVRRFPTPASQMLIALKLHHLFPRLPALRRYLAADFDYSRASRCDQVMGAAFCVRRKLIEEIGLLDAGFFIWFEEVDYCRRAADRGFQVWYAPEVEIVHHGGESFGQVFGPNKQKMFNASARRYFLKHHGWLFWFCLVLIEPLSMFLARLAAFSSKEKKS